METNNSVEFGAVIGPRGWVLPGFSRKLDVAILDVFSSVGGENHFEIWCIFPQENEVTIGKSVSVYSLCYDIFDVCLLEARISTRESYQNKHSCSSLAILRFSHPHAFIRRHKVKTRGLYTPQAF